MDDAVGKSTKEISALVAAKYGTQLRGRRHKLGNPLKFVHKRARQISIHLRRVISGSVLQLGERRRNDH